ncbi:MAG: hypothetical protein HND55_12540 [Pseudomonadota bacterium]|nr:MAG: hypothetical protein HND55_12540 [Pseudomonadota bacterium]
MSHLAARIIAAASTLLAGLLMPVRGSAQLAENLSQQERCARYAEESLHQVHRAREMNCDDGGPRWLADYDAHYAWCLSQDTSTLQDELEFRDNELVRCETGRKKGEVKAAPPPTMAPLDEARMMEGALEVVPPAELSASARCQAYTLTAVAQQRQNELERCGYTGSAWSADANMHRAWCADQVPATLDGETRARTAALQSCLGSEPAVGGNARCTAYAASAVDQATTQQTHNCNFSGARWSTDFLLHYRWCLKQRATQPEDHQAARNRQLADCGVSATPIPIPIISP